MDIATQLALMAKAKKVFGNDQTFLSFPLTPLPFTKQQLNFVEEKNLENLQKFSLLVNQLPLGEAWSPTEAYYLWDVYSSILRANFASSTRTATEEAAYQKAERYLREEGTHRDTPFLTAYKQFKDAWIVATENYTAAKSTALAATDPAEQQRWRDVEEPALRAKVDDSLKQWIAEGFKHEVEAAQATKAALGARSPHLTWSEWSSTFNPLIDGITSAIDLSTALSTSFSPSNALVDGAWQPFKLTEGEIHALMAEAPAELRSRLGVNSASIDTLTFEFSSATIQRHWFNSDVFKARFWKFDDGQLLSDGNTPPSGSCTGYVTAIVFARKLAVKPKADGSQNKSGKPDSNHFQFPVMQSAYTTVHPDAIRNAIRPEPEPLPKNVEAVKPITVNPGLFKDIRVNPALFQQIKSKDLTAGRPMMSLKANPGLTERFDRPQSLEGVVSKKDLLVARPKQQPNVATQHELVLERFHRLEQVKFDRLPPSPQEPPTNQAPSPAQPQPQDDSIYILAFICKRVPKCPDPDPNLQWL